MNLIASKKTKYNIVGEVIEDCLLEFPLSSALINFFKHYNQRGFLTKKQMTVLLAKAKETSNISSAKIATLEALIKKMPTRIKSAMPEIQPSFKKNPEVQLILNDIFAKFPEHKRALFLQSKYMNDEEINPHEMSELRQFQRIAAKK